MGTEPARIGQGVRAGEFRSRSALQAYEGEKRVDCQFASDNNAGICREALDAMLEANAEGHAIGYGGDAWTRRARRLIRDLFERDCEVHFAFNGTAANALVLAQLCRSYHAVLAHAVSHVATDEAGAPGFYSGGASLRTADTPHAKLTPEAVKVCAEASPGVHHVKPAALSLTQATELGTVYTPGELAALTETARSHGLKVHMDGARFANAVARLGCSPADLSWKAGIDVLCFGGVKNGLAVGEAIVFFDPIIAHEFEWRVKQSGQLNSKLRLAAAGWCGLVESGAWIGNARRANAMADRLALALNGAPSIRVTRPVEANAVFAEIPEAVQTKLRDRGWSFYTFRPPRECRLMCAWDTDAATVDRFAADLRAAVSAAGS
jgi:threonine aldolase